MRTTAVARKRPFLILPFLPFLALARTGLVSTLATSGMRCLPFFPT